MGGIYAEEGDVIAEDDGDGRVLVALLEMVDRRDGHVCGGGQMRRQMGNWGRTRGDEARDATDDADQTQGPILEETTMGLDERGL